MSSTMKLGELIDTLHKLPQEAHIRWEFCGLCILPVDSWRGVYAELALGYQRSAYAHNHGPKPLTQVFELLENLTSAIGREFTGYKGGEFIMDEQTPVWCDNYGEYSSTMITGIVPGRFNGWYAIRTAPDEA